MIGWMVKLFKIVGMKLKNLSPAAVREIIVIAIILCVSVVLCIPEYREDVKREKAWHEMQEKIEQMSEDSIN